MKLSELINMTALELELVGAGDKAARPILKTYLNLAYSQAIDLIGNVDDELELDVYAGDAELSVPDWVRHFKWAKLDGKTLDVVNRSDADLRKVRDDSPVSMLVLGDVPSVARLAGLPKANGLLRCGVLRGLKLPMNADSDSPSDLSPPTHSALCDYVVWRIAGAEDRLARFSAAIDHERHINSRKRSKPARTVVYGGI